MRDHISLLRTFLALAALVWLLSATTGVQASKLSQTILITPDSSPVQAPSGLTVEVTGPSEVNVGGTITLEVVASNIPDPGIFGYQFELNWDPAVFSPVPGTLSLNPDFPVVAQQNVTDGLAEIAVSREGDVGDLPGPLTLLTVDVQANAATEPDASSFTLTNVKLGRKGGIDVPVDSIINLDVVVTDVPTGGSV